MTPENYEDVLRECQKYCNTIESCEIFVNILIDKAWVQYKYTKLYAKMCIDMGERTWPWAKGKDAEEKQSNSHKKFKNFVVTKIRKEFLTGFRKFKENMIAWSKDPEMDEDFLFEKYLKDKNKIVGNITFISELYILSYLPHKVMRFITYKLITQYCDEIRQENEDNVKLRYPIYDEYLEALFKLLNFSGSKYVSREIRSIEKQQKEGKFVCSTAELNILIEYLIKSVEIKNFNYEKAVIVIPDEHRKEANHLDLVFNFINKLVEKKLLNARMEALVVNLNVQKKEGFRNDRTEQKGPMKLRDFEKEMAKENQPKRDRGDRDRRDDRFNDRGGRGGGRYDDGYAKKSSRGYEGGRDSRFSKNRYDDDEDYEAEYTKKGDSKETKLSRNAAPATKSYAYEEEEPVQEEENEDDQQPEDDPVEIAAGEISALFDETKKDDSFEPYEEFFTFSNENLNTLTLAQMLELWFNNYHNCWPKTALQRAKIPA